MRGHATRAGGGSSGGAMLPACGCASCPTTSTAPSASTAASARSASSSILGYYNPDVAILQEVDDGAPRSRELDLGQELARALGYEHYAIGHNVTLRKGRYGNATLSRWPIQRERNIDLTVGFLRRRGCQHTRIAVQHAGRARRGGSRSSTCTSGSPPASGSGRWPSSPARASSPRCPSACPRSWPATTTTGARCCGPSSWTCSASAPPPAATPTRERAIATFPSFFPQGSLDRIYYRGPLRLAAARRCRLALSRVASDHLPVIVDFDL